MARLKSPKITENMDSCDEDSVSCFESESETTNAHDESIEVEEFGNYQKFIDFFYSRYTFSVALSIILIVLSFFTWNYPIPISSESLPAGTSVSAGRICLFYGVLIFITINIGFEFKAITMHILKKSKGDASFCYYFNELSYYIASLIALIFQYFYFFNSFGDLYFEFTAGFKVKILSSLRIAMMSVFLLALLKALVKHVSMRFNYNTFINGIRKCILFDFFICLVSAIREADEDIVGSEKICSENVIQMSGNTENNGSSYSDERRTDDEEIMVDNSVVKNSFILKRRFRAEHVNDLSFSEKRLLIKEFFDLVSVASTYTGSMPVILGKIKSKAQHKASKLVNKLRRRDRIFKIGDLSKYFKNGGTFEYFINQLGLKQDENIEKDHISIIIEKTYKDRYVISKNLEQMNQALDKISASAKVLIFTFAVILFLVTSQTDGQMGFLSSCVSTVLGTQIISKILSDNVIQSIIFLFIIHPFDIGDRILVNLNGIQENLLVAELNVFSTTFFRWDGTFFFVPNSVLVNTPISNIRRSGAIMENHIIQISASTKPEKLQRLKEMLRSFVAERSDYYTDYILVNYDRIEDSNKLFIKVLMQYQSNFQHYEFYLKKKSVFIAELSRCLKSLKIEYKLPVQNVNVVKKGIESLT